MSSYINIPSLRAEREEVIEKNERWIKDNINILDNKPKKENLVGLIGPKGCGKTFSVLETLTHLINQSQKESNVQMPSIHYLHYKEGEFKELNIQRIIPEYTKNDVSGCRGVFNKADIVVIDDVHYALDDILNDCLNFVEENDNELEELPTKIQTKIDTLLNLVYSAIEYSHEDKKVIIVSEDSFVDKRFGNEMGAFECIDPRINEMLQVLGKHTTLESPVLNKRCYERFVDEGIFTEEMRKVLPLIVDTPRAALRVAKELGETGKDYPISTMDIIDYVINCEKNQDLCIKRKSKKAMTIDGLKKLADVYYDILCEWLEMSKEYLFFHCDNDMGVKVKYPSIFNNTLNHLPHDAKKGYLGKLLSIVARKEIEYESNKQISDYLSKFSFGLEYFHEDPERYNRIDCLIEPQRTEFVLLNLLKEYLSRGPKEPTVLIREGLKDLVNEDIYLNEKIMNPEYIKKK